MESSLPILFILTHYLNFFAHFDYDFEWGHQSVVFRFMLAWILILTPMIVIGLNQDL